MIKVIFFDLGGVVFTDFFSGGDQEFVQHLKLPQKKIFAAYVKTDLPEYSQGKIDDQHRWRLFVNELNLAETKAQICIDTFYRIYKPIEPTIKFLKMLKQNSPQIQIGVLSDQPTGITNFLKSQYQNIFSLFNSNLVLISSELGLSKKDKNFSFYKFALQKAGVNPEEILFVDNSKTNIANAASTGMQTFFFDIKTEPITALIQKLRQEVATLKS